MRTLFPGRRCLLVPTLVAAITAVAEAEQAVFLDFGSTGATLELTIGPPSPPPPNDECTGATAVADGLNANLSTIGATDSPESFSCSRSGADVWHYYVATCSGTIEVTTCSSGTTFDTTLSGWSGVCGALSEIACSTSDAGCLPIQQATMIMSVSAGTTYYISVGGFNGAAGNYDLTVSYPFRTGRFSTVHAGCGAATLSASGTPDAGGNARYDLTGQVGSSQIIWMGVANLRTPICAGCTIGPDFVAVFNLSSIAARIPCSPGVIGAIYYTQGADMIGAGGGCNLGGLDFTVTETIATVIGG